MRMRVDGVFNERVQLSLLKRKQHEKRVRGFHIYIYFRRHRGNQSSLA